MRKIIYVTILSLVLFSGCGTTASTYMDISPMQLSSISARLGKNVDTLWTSERALLRTEISEDLGMQVVSLSLPTPNADVESGLIAEIESATTAAMKKTGTGALEDPSKKGIIAAAISGGIILLTGALGMRGRGKRIKAAAVAMASDATPPPTTTGGLA